MGETNLYHQHTVMMLRIGHSGEGHLYKSRIIGVPRWNLEGHHRQWSCNQKENHLHKFFAYNQSDMIETILCLCSQPH